MSNHFDYLTRYQFIYNTHTHQNMKRMQHKIRILILLINLKRNFEQADSFYSYEEFNKKLKQVLSWVTKMVASSEIHDARFVLVGTRQMDGLAYK